jgi:hypothetical protein
MIYTDRIAKALSQPRRFVTQPGENHYDKACEQPRHRRRGFIGRWVPGQRDGLDAGFTTCGPGHA